MNTEAASFSHTLEFRKAKNLTGQTSLSQR